MLTVMRGRFHRTFALHDCRATDWFAGFQITGRLGSEELLALLARLPEGTTELMTHPGRCTEELRGSPTRLKECREEELKALTDAGVRQALKANGMNLLATGTCGDAAPSGMILGALAPDPLL